MSLRWAKHILFLIVAALFYAIFSGGPYLVLAVAGAVATAAYWAVVVLEMR